jgi:methyl halide transferase
MILSSQMPDVNISQFWETAYRNNQSFWDLGRPTPVFCRLVENGQYAPGNMIVPGAGRGHDARLFARYGFTVTAVDFADAAVRDMRLLAEPDAPLTIVQVDFFALPPVFEGAFDYVLEYVTYCAINPSRRVEYADVVQRLLKPGGTYIGLIFPIGNHAGGPPFAVSPDQLITDLAARGFRLLHREFPPDSVKPRKGKEELLVLQKKPDHTP